jgi:hypothetical protein
MSIEEYARYASVFTYGYAERDATEESGYAGYESFGLRAEPVNPVNPQGGSGSQETSK